MIMRGESRSRLSRPPRASRKFLLFERRLTTCDWIDVGIEAKPRRINWENQSKHARDRRARVACGECARFCPRPPPFTSLSRPYFLHNEILDFSLPRSAAATNSGGGSNSGKPQGTEGRTEHQFDPIAQKPCQKFALSLSLSLSF